MSETRCKRPDRDVPQLVCDYPIPCRWHTLVVDTTCEPPTITVPATAKAAMKSIRQLREIARDIKDALDEKRGKR